MSTSTTQELARNILAQEPPADVLALAEAVLEESHNGWPNRETWAAALHLSNDQALVGTCEALAEQAISEAHDPKRYSIEIVPSTEDVRRIATNRCADALAELIESWAQDAKTCVTGGEDPQFVGETVAMMLDEIGSRWRVDWRAIAEGYVAEALQEGGE